MRLRLLLPLVFCLAASSASAGVIEDLFRRLIDQRKSTLNWLPNGALPQMAHEITKPVITERKDGLVLGQSQYAIFVAPRCRTCDAAVTSLRKRGYKVEVLDLAASATAREAFELTGATGVPTVLAGRRMLGGWSDKAFTGLLVAEQLEWERAQRGTGA